MRSLIVRAGDFFGPRAGNNWFSQGLVKPNQAVHRINQPGQPGVGHQWSYMPDVARTMVLLLDREEALETFACFHMAGHWDASGTQMIETIQHAVLASGGAQPKVSRLPWWLMALAGPVVPLFREMQEMRYLWQHPLRMDNARLVALLGHEPHTPWSEAVRAALIGQGNLPASAAPARNMAPTLRPVTQATRGIDVAQRT